MKIPTIKPSLEQVLGEQPYVFIVKFEDNEVLIELTVLMRIRCYLSRSKREKMRGDLDHIVKLHAPYNSLLFVKFI